jgi:hypothetical protein
MHSTRSIRPATRFAAAVLGLWLAGPADAQETPKIIQTPQLSQAAQAGWFQTDIVGGRIAVNGRRFGSTTTQSKGNGADEQLTIRIAGGSPTISYKISGPEGDLSLEISSADKIEIRQTPNSGSKLEAIEFRQAGDEPVTLAVGQNEGRKTYSGKTLWHLLIEEPDAFGDYLIPLLTPVAGRNDITALAQQIDAALLRAGVKDSRAEREKWARLVDQLGDDRYSRRESADRQLRQAGPLVATFLGQLDRAKLDAEQQYRIHRITEALSDQAGDDTPELVASLLVGDPEIWLALCARPDESTRRLAARQLESLLGHPLDFDPAADEKTRAAQIEQLRPQIVRP